MADENADQGTELDADDSQTLIEDASGASHVPANKKEQIIALYMAGMHEIEDLAMVMRTRPSYIASVLREADLEDGYFDLYTSTKHPMNVYSKFFTDKLGFKDEEVATASVAHIDLMYRQFDVARDRAGQHHSLLMALTMANRAQWTGKHDEASIFRQWLIDALTEFEEAHAAFAAGSEEE